jgi:hypothetical protein
LQGFDVSDYEIADNDDEEDEKDPDYKHVEKKSVRAYGMMFFPTEGYPH